jgi:anaerobic magnesium-protoporphyrin IX monomethyl ester cyclase
MKVLLADAPWQFLKANGTACGILPLGIGYIGAVLKNHHDVLLWLPDTYPYKGDDPWGVLRSIIANENPDVLGIAAVTATYPAAVRLAAEAKSINPAIITVLGGVHASIDPKKALENAPGVDFVVRGEGERTLPELIGALSSDQGRIKLETIDGLCFLEGAAGAIHWTKERKPIQDLDALPFPMRDHLVWSDPVPPAIYQAMITSRGCPFDCIYCAAPTLCGSRVRFRSVQNVLKEMVCLVERHQVSNIFFQDSVFTLNRSRTRELCRMMIDHKVPISFQCQTRVDLVDPGLLDTMKAAGCDHIFLGIESGDPDTLQRIGKAVTPESIQKAVAMITSSGIQCSGFFMIGFPWETEKMMRRTEELALGAGLDSVILFSATPLPGSGLWDMAGDKVRENDIDFRTPMINLTPLSERKYVEIFNRMEGRFTAYNQKMMMKRIENMPL